MVEELLTVEFKLPRPDESTPTVICTRIEADDIPYCSLTSRTNINEVTYVLYYTYIVSYVSHSIINGLNSIHVDAVQNFRMSTYFCFIYRLIYEINV